MDAEHLYGKVSTLSTNSGEDKKRKMPGRNVMRMLIRDLQQCKRLEQEE